MSPRGYLSSLFFRSHGRDPPNHFRLGIPKPISCKILEGEAKVGNTRQCTTDMGYIRQEIVELIDNEKLVYEMRETNVWCRRWVEFLRDTFLLEAVGSDQTRVRRITEFRGANSIPVLSTLALWFSLRQAHRYAAKNWRRMSSQLKGQRAVN